MTAENDDLGVSFDIETATGQRLGPFDAEPRRDKAQCWHVCRIVTRMKEEERWKTEGWRFDCLSTLAGRYGRYCLIDGKKVQAWPLHDSDSNRLARATSVCLRWS